MYSVSQLVREAQTMKEQRDQQIAELKTLAEQSGETAQHGFEKKVSTSLYLLIILVRCFVENKENCTHNLVLRKCHSLLTAQHPFQREWQGYCFLVALIQLNDKIAEFEQEKFEMQKQHTQNIQELLDETNQRLQKMETEYNQQNAATVSETCIVLSIFAK